MLSARGVCTSSSRGRGRSRSLNRHWKSSGIRMEGSDIQMNAKHPHAKRQILTTPSARLRRRSSEGWKIRGDALRVATVRPSDWRNDWQRRKGTGENNLVDVKSKCINVWKKCEHSFGQSTSVESRAILPKERTCRKYQERGVFPKQYPREVKWRRNLFQ